jgi:hypothetical protein
MRGCKQGICMVNSIVELEMSLVACQKLDFTNILLSFLQRNGT